MSHTTTPSTVQGRYDILIGSSNEAPREKLITLLKGFREDHSFSFLRKAQRGKWSDIKVLRVWTEHVDEAKQKEDLKILNIVLGWQRPEPVQIAGEDEVKVHETTWFPDKTTHFEQEPFDL